MTHGTPSQYASFCRPPESVTTTARLRREREHLEVAERLDRVRRAAPSRCRARRATCRVRGWTGKTNGQPVAFSAVDDPGGARSGSVFASRWIVSDDIRLARTPSRGRERPRAIGANRREASAITSPTTSTRPRTPSAASVSARALVGAEQERGDRSTSIRFRSSGIERSPLRSPASTCAMRHARARGRARAGERRVRVAVDEHPVGPLRSSAAAIRGRIAAASAVRRSSAVARLREPELLEEDLRQLAVVVLAGVQHDLVDSPLPQRERERAPT